MSEISMHLDMFINEIFDIKDFKNFSVEELNEGAKYLQKRLEPYKSQVATYNAAPKYNKPFKWGRYMHFKRASRE